MLKLPKKQAHVLVNIDHVIPLQSNDGEKLPRYQLDGQECTPQITNLVTRKLVSARGDGGFQRLGWKTKPHSGEANPHCPAPWMQSEPFYLLDGES